MVAVSSGGAAPVLARQSAPGSKPCCRPGWAGWPTPAETLRPAVKQRLTDPEQRRRFWEQVLQAPSIADARGRPEATVADWQRQLAGAGTTAAEGEILIVGCGSGAPDELTLRGLQVHRNALAKAHPATIAEPVLAPRDATPTACCWTCPGPDDWLPHCRAGPERTADRPAAAGDGRQGGEWMTYWRNAGLRCVSRALGVQAD